MEPYPTLRTARLILRALTLEASPEAPRLAAAREVAEMVYPIPHPYTADMAGKWIATHRPAFGPQPCCRQKRHHGRAESPESLRCFQLLTGFLRS